MSETTAGAPVVGDEPVSPTLRCPACDADPAELKPAPGVTEAQLAEALDGLGVDIRDGDFLAAGIIDRPAEVAKALRIRLESASDPKPAPELAEQLAATRLVLQETSRESSQRGEACERQRLELLQAQGAGEEARTRLGRLQDGIRQLAGDLTRSAAATMPSRKSTIEHEAAIALRKLLEDE